MRRIGYLPWLLVLTAAVAGAASDEEVVLEHHSGDITARLSVDVADFGDGPKIPVTLTVEVEGPAELQVEDASLDDPVGGWEIVRLPRTITGKERRTCVQVFKLMVKKPGANPLPVVSVRFRPSPAAPSWDRAEWSKILDRTASAPPFEPPPPLPPAPDWRPWAAGAGVMVLLGLGVLASRRWRRPVPVLGPRERALRELEAMGAADRDPIAVHDHLAQALRAFLAARFGIPAGQRTTVELLTVLHGVADLPAEQQERILTLLARCDAVRFGGGGCTQNEANAALTEARQFVGQVP